MPGKTLGSALPLLAIALAALLAIALGFVARHRSAIELPEPGPAVRAGHAPATALETVDRGVSVATRLRLNGRSASPTTAWLRVPRALDADYEILLTYVGHKTEGRILDLIPERRDLVLMAMQYAAEYRRDTWREKIALPRTVSGAVRDTVAGGMLALAELEHRGFELERLTVLGASVGCFFAVLHGAYDEAVPRVLVVHGGADIRRILESWYRSEGRPWTGRLVGGLAYLFLDPYDSVHHVARIAPRDFTLIAARGDAYFPEPSARLLYDAARPPKALVWNEGAHVRSRRADIIADLVTQIDLYLDGRLELDESEAAELPDQRSAPAASSAR
ncbi:MAG: hypothetical protein OEP45_04705 [Acidobacteriota bacterium]|nr:hypothetical protein [Acidobacteriota bacterium]